MDVIGTIGGEFVDLLKTILVKLSRYASTMASAVTVFDRMVSPTAVTYLYSQKPHVSYV